MSGELARRRIYYTSYISFCQPLFYFFLPAFYSVLFFYIFYKKKGGIRTQTGRGSRPFHFILLLIFLDCRLIQVISLGIDHDNYREILYFQFPDRLSPKVIIGNDLRLFNALG